MNKVDVESNWGYWDRLDGVLLKDGDTCAVRWPDGSETVEVVRIDHGTFEYEDMGHRGRGADDKAYLEISHRGHSARVYLRHTKLLLERRGPPQP